MISYAKKLEWFWSKVEKTESCWIWTGVKSPSGYGLTTWKRKAMKAHRFAYELLVGPIESGLTLDHLCQNKACVRPLHLDPVTAEENTRRYIAANRKTHCPTGHVYTPKNTFIGSKKERKCRACAVDLSKARKLKRSFLSKQTSPSNGVSA